MPPVVLVVDDNAVNRGMLVHMLAARGLLAHQAADGQEAVQVTTTHPCDLIFMDCMMPVLDGIEATKSIRASTNSSAHSWIVAVTANTLSHDRDRCRAAGMDDYLAKPFHLEALDVTLVRWAQARGFQDTLRQSPAVEAPSMVPGQEVDFTGLEQLVRFAGRQALRDVAGVFLDEYATQMSALKQAHDRGDAERVRQIAHRLRGACGTAGLIGAQRLAACIEEHALRHDMASATASFAPLVEAITCGAERLRGLLHDERTPTAPQRSLH